MNNNLRNSYINAIQPLLPKQLSQKNTTSVFLPLRVNFSAGWNDTPPYCNEVFGHTLNAPILLNGLFPVSVTIQKLTRPEILLTNLNTNQTCSIHHISQILDCQSPSANFALPKACLLASGLFPFDAHYNLDTFFKDLEGFELSFCVKDIPVGSGLGTSSILIYSCLKALFDFFNFPKSDIELFHMTACAEQIMTTGGGYQDQIGCYCRDFKFITFSPAPFADITCENLELPFSLKEELNSRLCFVYTGCTRVAKNLLDKIVTNYLNKDSSTLNTLQEIGITAQDMKTNLINCDLESFAQNMIKSFDLNLELNPSFSNERIQKILTILHSSIRGYMLSGAGNGGFLTLLLKKNVSKEDIKKLLDRHFQNSNVKIYNFSLYF